MTCDSTTQNRQLLAKKTPRTEKNSKYCLCDCKLVNDLTKQCADSTADANIQTKTRLLTGH